MKEIRKIPIGRPRPGVRKLGDVRFVRKPNAPTLPYGKQGLVDTYIATLRNPRGMKPAVHFPKWVAEYVRKWYFYIPVTKPKPPVLQPMPRREPIRMRKKPIPKERPQPSQPKPIPISRRIVSRHHTKQQAMEANKAYPKSSYVKPDTSRSRFRWDVVRRQTRRR